MPFATMASAVCSISCALTLQPNAFQSLKPMGGVRANPLSSAAAGVARTAWVATAPEVMTASTTRRRTAVRTTKSSEFDIYEQFHTQTHRVHQVNGLR